MASPVQRDRIPPVNSRLCRRLAVCAAVAAAGFPVLNAILWLVPEWAPIAAREQAHLQIEPITLTSAVRWIGLACSTLYLSVLVGGLWIARSLFRRLAEGLVFEPETGVLLRRFGLTLLIYAGITPPFGALMSWLVTHLNAPGKRLLTFGISDQEVLFAIIGTLIVTTGSVMAEAARMADDSRQII
jgi:hypothetical protein